MLEASVIVPFYGDQNKLMRCLDSLRESSLASDLFEILIVDNHHSPTLSEKDFTGVSILHESTPGSYAARNKGLTAAKGAYLFFTDADTTVDREWLEKGLAFLKRNDPCLVGGKIQLEFENPQSPSALELYEKVFYFQQKSYIENESYAATANLFGYREIFTDLKGFDSSLRSGGDQEFCHRACEKGFPLFYCDSANVFHPSRARLKDFLKRRLRAFSGNLYLFHREHGLSKTMVKEKLAYFLNPAHFRQWQGDWDFFDSLTSSQQKSVQRWHRFMCWFDVLTLIYCQSSFKRLKKLTLIDRH